MCAVARGSPVGTPWDHGVVAGVPPRSRSRGLSSVDLLRHPIHPAPVVPRRSEDSRRNPLDGRWTYARPAVMDHFFRFERTRMTINSVAFPPQKADALASQGWLNPSDLGAADLLP